ncbi:hypothetical protein AB7C87_10635 [Natrarchaeobius sp. A-rgal3]|uniref:hypothetical protein n=1 Tax=Natrarchaeobius versutus TaxID=1679078 RepID=UPI0035106726
MPSRETTTTRRAFLASSAIGFATVLAGCVEPGGALTMAPVGTDEEIGAEATLSLESDRDSETLALLEDAHTDGEATVDGERPPFRPDRPLEFRSAVFEVSWAAVDERTETGYVVTATIGSEDVGEPEIAFEDLPAVDRSALAALPERVAAHEDRDEPALGAVFEYDRDGADLEGSALVPDPEYEVIEVEGEPVGIRSRETETTVHTYRYELEEVASSTAEYGTQLRHRSVALDSLTDDERELVEEAIEDGRAVVSRDDDAFVSVGERLLEEEPIYEDEYTGEWLIEYEGALYWTELDALRTRQLVEQLGEEGE